MNSVAEFLQDVGFHVTKSYGNEIVAYCPWHEDSTASLAINTENGWHCFAGCGKGRTLESLLLKFAPNKKLHHKFAAAFPDLYLESLNMNPTQVQEVKPLYDVDALPMAYENEYLASRGITAKTVNDFNLKYHKGFNSIVIPIYQNAELVGSVQRKIVGNPKYINSLGMNKDQILFPFDKVQPIDRKVIVVEGIFDAIKAHQEGVTNVLSSFGGSMSQGHVRMLGSIARTVAICPDKDRAGLKMAERSTEMLLDKGLEVEYVFPSGKAKDFGDMDVDDFSQLKYHSYWKLQILKKSLNTMMERSNA
jgi:DNA primase